MPLNIGTIVYLKTTEEPCFVLDIAKQDTPSFPGLSGELAIVRRPIAGESGVSHSIDTFFAEELQTKEEYQSGRRAGFMDMFGNAVGQQGEAIVDGGVSAKNAN